MNDRAVSSPKVSRLGRYEILSELGKGAMGIVYLAKDPAIGRLVAIKTIRAAGGQEDDSESREFRERFLREAQTAGILSHPNIVTIFDVGEDAESSVSFIAMEYIEGKTIKGLLAESTHFSADQIADIIGQVAEALDYAHRKGIVHRDIKPANVMITMDGKVKITDFGIAKVASSNLTTTGQFLGTPNYMSPEQVTGAPVDGRSDIFSLGVVLYEMLSRRKPFSGENLTTISYKIVHETFTPVGDITKHIPEEFDTILGKALSKDPWNRYQRGKDFALALYQAKARFEEQAIFQDLGAMVSSAENLPTLKLENLEKLAREAAATSETVVAASQQESASDFSRSTRPTGDVAVPIEATAGPTPELPAAVGPEEPFGSTAESIEAAASPEVPAEPAAQPVRRSARASVLGAAVNPKYWWGIVAAAVLIAVGALAIIRLATPNAEDQQAAVVKSRATLEVSRSVEKGKVLYRQGRYQESLAVFRSVLQRDPTVKEARDYSQMCEEALRSEQVRKATDEEKNSRIASHLQVARADLASGNFDQALSESDAVLNLDAQNADAKSISNDAREAIAREKQAELRNKGRAKKKASTIASNPSPRATAPAPSSQPAAAPRPVVTANTPATLNVNFVSSLPRGFLMIAVNDKIVYRKNFDFGREKGGTINDVLRVAPGSSTVKVWLTSSDSSIKGYVPLPVTFAPGDTHTLIISVQGTKFGARVS